MNGEIAESIAVFLKKNPENNIIKCFNSWSQKNKLIKEDTDVVYALSCFEHFTKNREQLNAIALEEENK